MTGSTAGEGGVARRPRQASPRALALGAAAVFAVGVLIALGVLLRGSSNGPSVPRLLRSLPAVGDATGPLALPGAPDANALFEGIPQNGLVLGSPHAPVELEMFVDVQCPFCRNYETSYLPALVRRYIRPGKVKLYLQPWALIGPQSQTGRLALIAASFQNRAFEFAQVLYDNQGEENTGWLTDERIGQIGASVSGLDLRELFADMRGSGASSIGDAVDALAKRDNVQVTPTVLVGLAGEKLRDIAASPLNSPTLSDTERALDTALSASR
jgi:protein-disulfide isomerase